MFFKIIFHSFNYYGTFKILPCLSVSSLVSGDGFFVTFAWCFRNAQWTVYTRVPENCFLA